MTVVLLLLASLPLLLPFLLRSSLSFLGERLYLHTRSRRDALIALSRKDSAIQAAGQTPPEDSDWEHVSTPPRPSPGSHSNSLSTPSSSAKPVIVGFFHPFSNAGGGGERVLWAAIRATQDAFPNAICVVYTGDHDIDRDMMVESTRNRFGIIIQKAALHFVYLSRRDWVLASAYPHFTLLGQSLGSVGLAFDALSMLVPDIFIDTMGYAFAVAFCKFLFPWMPTGAYVHYPTISTDMLDSLDDTSGERGLNAGAGAGVKGSLKRHYWKLFAALYGWVGRHIDVVMCNSSWTRAHITAIWKTKSPPSIVYPPCPVEELAHAIPISSATETQRENIILYIAQFRPEKNHALILSAFAKYLHSLPEPTDPTSAGNNPQTPSFSGDNNKPPNLTLIGSVRPSTPDERHVYNLRLLARELKVAHATTFICDASLAQVRTHLQRASVGVNGMWNEHFGIGVVEYLAAGLIPVVHDSGGPKLDIVVPLPGDDGGGPTGFLADSVDGFAHAFDQVARMSPSDRLAMRLRGREAAARFTERAFRQAWVENLRKLLTMLDRPSERA